MTIRIVLLAIILELGLLSCSPMALAQYPAQRFGKVTAAQVETGSVTLTSGTLAATIAAPDVARWNSIKSGIAVESDPVFGASAAGAITGADVAAWNGFVVNNAWLTHALYPGEVLSLRSLNLSRAFGSGNRLLVQGFAGAGWSGNLALNLGSGSSNEIRAAHLFTNLPLYQTPHYYLFDHDPGMIWWVYNQPAGVSYWLAYKFDVPTQVNRVRHSKYGGWGNPWPSFTVWGSDDSTNGSDGHWTQLAGPFTLGTGMEAVTTSDFPQNTRSFLWIKLVGAPKTLVENAGVREIELESYQPAPDKRFWVDAQGNPGTDGVMTAGALKLTSGTLAATITLADAHRWGSAAAPLWSLIPTTTNISSGNARVAVGTTDLGTEQFLVQGYAASTAWSGNLTLDTDTTADWAARSSTNLVDYRAGKGAYYAFDHSTVAEQENGLDAYGDGVSKVRYVSYRFDTPTVVNRVRIIHYGGWSYPFTTFSVWGSNDSTDGNSGNWTKVSGPLTPDNTTNTYSTFDFTANASAFSWWKVQGDSAYVGNATVGEIEYYRLEAGAPVPARQFYVDAGGNPGTTGNLTLETLSFTPRAAPPGSPRKGQAYFDDPSRKLRVWDGAAWQDAW